MEEKTKLRISCAYTIILLEVGKNARHQRPTLRRKGVRNVLFEAESKGLTIPQPLRHEFNEEALKEVLKRTDWQQSLSQSVEVRRVWGAV